MSSHQDRVCSVVRRFLADRVGEAIEIDSRPDAEERRVQAVEEIWRSPTCLYAVEHTRVEAFEGQVLDDQRFMELIAPLEGILNGRVPGRFGLRVDVGAATTARVRYGDAQRRIADWVVMTAPQLAVGVSAVFQDPMVPFAVRLTRDRGDGSKVLVGRFLTGEFDSREKRVSRISRALNDKCPKLAEWARGGEAVLILESNDIALSNYAEIAETVIAELSMRSDVPDWIFLVESELAPEFVLWIAKEHARLFPAVENPGPHYLGH